MRIVVVLVLVASVLGGCAESGPEMSTANDGNHVHGEYYTCPDGTKLDPASFPEHHDPDFDVSTKCPAEGTPAAVSLTVPAATIVVYDAVELKWDISPATGQNKVGATEIRVSSVSIASPGAPAEYGELVKQFSNQDVPKVFRTTWTPQEPGTYYVRAYAKFTDASVWSKEATIVVEELPETGETKTVTISAAGPLAALSPGSLDMKAGDALVFQNDDLLPHTFTVTDGPETFTVTVQALKPSQPLVLFRIGTYEYEDAEAGLRGSITVTL